MKVKDVIKKEVMTVKRSTSLRSLMNLFKDFHALPIIPVVDEEGLLIGVVALSNLMDILKPPQVKMLKKIPFAEIDETVFDLEPAPAMGELILADDIMETHFLSLDQEVSLAEAYKFMRLHRTDQFPVVDSSNHLLGIVGVFDIVRRMFKEKGII
ncbi:MAG: CBS domain-containing protein [Candidatus Omnitrophota bacterium]|nr:MAG: CBS domain-containing protein [Candidatus Omnitrophota bacterium]